MTMHFQTRGDSRAVTCQTLSVTSTGREHPAQSEKKSGAQIAGIEMTRRQRRIPQTALVAAAGISLKTYHRIRVDPDRAASDLLARLAAALDRLTTPSPDGELLASFRAFAAALAPAHGVTLAAVLASDPRSGATADPVWLACARVRQASLYLVSTVYGTRQRRIAEALGLTPAAVCLALKAVEDRRDDPAFDQLLREAAQLIAGRPA